MATKIQARRDTAANWTSVNPVLADGEPGFEHDTGKFKFGNGTAAWNSLAYAGGGAIADLSITSRMLTDLSRAGGFMPRDSSNRPAIAETVSRRVGVSTVNSSLGNAQLKLAACSVIPGGRAVTAITFVSGTTALAGATHQWFCLVDAATLAILAVTTDDTAAAWAASTPKTLALTTPYTPTNALEAYVGIVVAATTVPTLTSASGTAALLGITPVIAGTSGAGGSLTDPASLASPVAAPVASSTTPYAFVS